MSFWVLSQCSLWVLSQFEFLNFVTIWVFGFYKNLRFWVFSPFEFLSFITIWVSKFYQNLRFLVSSGDGFMSPSLVNTNKFWIQSYFRFHKNFVFTRALPWRSSGVFIGTFLTFRFSIDVELFNPVKKYLQIEKHNSR